MKTTTLIPKELKNSHKAVAPVIATLLMVAIAVVGGTIIFVFAQGFFSSSQISGTPQIESLKIEGYDARAVDFLQMHDGNDMLATSGDGNSGLLLTGFMCIMHSNKVYLKCSIIGQI